MQSQHWRFLPRPICLCHLQELILSYKALLVYFIVFSLIVILLMPRNNSISCLCDHTYFIVQLLKDLTDLERIQRQSTKFEFILIDYTSDYKSRLLKLKLLPLMYMLDLSDIVLHAGVAMIHGEC